jgi:uncharacterized lipoprotein YajG
VQRHLCTWPCIADSTERSSFRRLPPACGDGKVHDTVHQRQLGKQGVTWPHFLTFTVVVEVLQFELRVERGRMRQSLATDKAWVVDSGLIAKTAANRQMAAGSNAKYIPAI